MILPLTGDFGFFGEEARRGIELAFEEIEKAYPARFQLVIEDDGCKAKNAVTAYEKLVTVERADMVIGPACTGSILSVSPATARRNVKALALLDAGEQVEKAEANILALGFSSEAEGRLVAERMIALGQRRGAVLFEEDEWAILVKRAFEDRFTALGGVLLSDVSHNVNDKDYRTSLLKALQPKPDGLFIAPAFSGGLLLKQLRQLDPKIAVYGPDTFGVPDVLQVAGTAADGVEFANVIIDEASPKAVEISTRLTERYGNAPGSLLYTALGYEALKIAALSLTSPEIFSNSGYRGELLNFGGFANGRIARLEPRLMRIRNGRFEPL